MLICQELTTSSGYYYGQSGIIWFDSRAKDCFAPDGSQYDTTWYMPRTKKSGSGISISITQEYFKILDSGVIDRGNLADNNIYLTFTAIKFKMAQ